MKALLVIPTPSNQSFGLSSFYLPEPLALEYLGAGIQKNHDVRILDLRADTEPGLKEVLESFQPDIIGCGACTMEVNSTKAIFAEAKKILPGILTVVGGTHATVMPPDFFTEDIDVVVKGEGVDPFKKICDYHETGKSFADIENIYYRENGKMVFTREEPYPPLDTLPLPDRSLTAHVRDKYLTIWSSDNKLTPWASIRGSAGCFYHCKFCSASSLRKHKIYTRSIENIIRELEVIDEKYVFWVDDELLIDPKWSLNLAREITRSGVKKLYGCGTRSDTIVRHPEVLEEWAKAGMDYVFIGLEGFRDKDLKTMKKGTNTIKNDEAVHICHQFGIKVRGGFIIMPDFDKKDFKLMGKYMRQSGVDLMSVSIYTPLPGTELWEEKKTEFITDNYDHFDYAHPVVPTKLPVKQFYKEYFNAIRGFFTIRKKIKLLKEMSPDLRRKYIENYKHIKKVFKNFENYYTPSISSKEQQ